jgi:hypothetical protein
MASIIPSKNVFGADNQQERLKIAYWIVGFTDGEGCFKTVILRILRDYTPNSLFKKERRYSPNYIAICRIT